MSGLGATLIARVRASPLIGLPRYRAGMNIVLQHLRSLQVRVVLLVLVPGTAIAVLLTGYFLHGRFDDLERAHLERGRALARQLAPAAQYGLFAGDREEMARLCAAVLREPDVVAVTIRDRHGDVLAVAGDATPGHRLPGVSLVAAETALEDRQRHAFIMPVVGAELRLEPYFDQPNPQRQLGVVSVELSLHNLARLKHQRLLYSALAALLILLLSTLAAIRLGQRLTRPVRDLSRTVSALARGDFSVRAGETSNGEILTLERGVNRMASALSESHQHLQQRIAEATAELAARKEEAEHSSASKTRFLAAASHDLRQPMQALGLWVSALRLQAREPAVAEMSVKIEASVNALGEMLNALLDISKLDAGSVRPEMRAVSLDVMLDRLALQFDAQARAKGLHLVVRHCGLAVRSDPVLLNRILHNLVANAIKYTAHGRILLCARRRAGQVRLEVRDSGPGIEAQRQALVFEEFYQIDNPERDRDKGLGLGLAIVQRLTRLLGHGCELRSAPGRGSTFAVSASAANPADVGGAVTITDAEDFSVLKGLTVAVLDDDALVRASLTDLLRGHGCVTLAVATAAELDQQLRTLSAPPDLLICDYRLPHGENGVEVINRLRANLYPDLPCLLISGDLDPDVSRLAHSSQIRLLQKPVEAVRLARALVGLLA